MIKQIAIGFTVMCIVVIISNYSNFMYINTTFGSYILDAHKEEVYNNRTTAAQTSTSWTELPSTSRKYFKTSSKKVWIPGTVEYAADLLFQCKKEAQYLKANGISESTLCPCVPSGIPRRQEVINVTQLLSMTWPQIENHILDLDAYGDLIPGGHFKPSGCISRRKVIIIIPFRDRESHLRAFLSHHLPIWSSQLVEFRIFVVEQNKPFVFNKAAMMNVGFLEAKQLVEADCVVFHDVDLLVETNGNMLTCWKHPIHLTPFIDKFEYILPYPNLLGGGVSMKPSTFESINGYPNTYFGWGGEDDDLSGRLRTKRLVTYRGPYEISRYTSLPHDRDKANPYNTKSYLGLRINRQHYRKDGLNSGNLKYNVVKQAENPLYTWLLIDIIEPKSPEASKTKTFIDVHAICTYENGTIDVNNTGIYQHTVSRSTCSGMCINNEGCVAFSYHVSNTTDSFCQTYNQTGCVNITPSDSSELHVEQTYFSKLYYS